MSADKKWQEGCVYLKVGQSHGEEHGMEQHVPTVACIALPAGGTVHHGADTVAPLKGSAHWCRSRLLCWRAVLSKQLPRGELRAFISLVPPAKAGKECLTIWRVLDGDTMTSINVSRAG